MSKRDDGFFLLNIVDALNDVISYTADGQAAFIAEKMRRDAVERKFEILGEAVKNLSSEFCAKYPKVKWSHMARFRDMLSHHYFGIDYNIVWDISQTSVPEALALITQIPEYIAARQKYDNILENRERILDILLKNRDAIYSMLNKYSITEVSVFSKTAIRQETPEDPVELLVTETSADFSLLDMTQLQNELTILLDRKVCICSRDSQLFKEQPELLDNIVII